MGLLISLVKSGRFILAMKGKLGVVNDYELTGLVGDAYEVMVKCGTKGGLVELDALGIPGGGLVGEDASYSFLT